MYLHFFGLAEPPFSMTPDPRFLYLSPAHREALARLTYAVWEHKGFMVLTGEVGTGKTTLLQTMLRKLGGETAVAFVFNSTLPFDGILEYMLEDLGLGGVWTSRAQRLVALNTFLVERRRARRNTVLLLDEAQNLSPTTLEEIRLLSNFETPSEKLLQIILVGQPELETNLALPELRQLRQRIALRACILPLSLRETRDYIRVRLRVAGASDLDFFPDRSVEMIARYSGGIPRVVNVLCDHCLLLAYAEQTRRVTPHLVRDAIAAVEGDRRRRWFEFRRHRRNGAGHDDHSFLARTRRALIPR
jgi:general secretion pathway protein A